MRKKRILMVAPSWGTYGGIEAFAAAIAQEFLSFSDEFEIRIVFRLQSKLPPTPDFDIGLRSHGISWRVMRNIDAAYLKDLFWADVINCHFPLLYATIPALCLRKKLVVTIENKRNSSHGALYTWPLRQADARWYISSFVAGTWGDDLSDEKSKIIPAISELPVAWVDPSKRKGFFFIARWIPGKGLRNLIEAYCAASIDHSRHPLVLVGDGPLRQEIEQLIQYSGKSMYIHCPGFVSHSEKTALMASALWNVAPQTFPEDLGLSPIEARSCGVPSIVSDTGGLPEAGGESALKVMPDDVESLQKALETATGMSEENYTTLAHNCKSSLEEYLAPPHFYTSQFRKLISK